MLMSSDAVTAFDTLYSPHHPHTFPSITALQDAECVGRYTQVFFVSRGQRGCLELGVADPEESVWVEETAQRVLLDEGDSFFVPSGNPIEVEGFADVDGLFAS